MSYHSQNLSETAQQAYNEAQARIKARMQEYDAQKPPVSTPTVLNYQRLPPPPTSAVGRAAHSLKGALKAVAYASVIGRVVAGEPDTYKIRAPVVQESHHVALEDLTKKLEDLYKRSKQAVERVATPIKREEKPAEAAKVQPKDFFTSDKKTEQYTSSSEDAETAAQLRKEYAHLKQSGPLSPQTLAIQLTSEGEKSAVELLKELAVKNYEEADQKKAQERKEFDANAGVRLSLLKNYLERDGKRNLRRDDPDKLDKWENLAKEYISTSKPVRSQIAKGIVASIEAERARRKNIIDFLKDDGELALEEKDLEEVTELPESEYTLEIPKAITPALPAPRFPLLNAKRFKSPDIQYQLMHLTLTSQIEALNKYLSSPAEGETEDSTSLSVVETLSNDELEDLIDETRIILNNNIVQGERRNKLLNLRNYLVDAKVLKHENDNQLQEVAQKYKDTFEQEEKDRQDLQKETKMLHANLKDLREYQIAGIKAREVAEKVQAKAEFDANASAQLQYNLEYLLGNQRKVLKTLDPHVLMTIGKFHAENYVSEDKPVQSEMAYSIMDAIFEELATRKSIVKEYKTKKRMSLDDLKRKNKEERLALAEAEKKRQEYLNAVFVLYPQKQGKSENKLAHVNIAQLPEEMQKSIPTDVPLTNQLLAMTRYLSAPVFSLQDRKEDLKNDQLYSEEAYDGSIIPRNVEVMDVKSLDTIIAETSRVLGDLSISANKSARTSILANGVLSYVNSEKGRRKEELTTQIKEITEKITKDSFLALNFAEQLEMLRQGVFFGTLTEENHELFQNVSTLMINLEELEGRQAHPNLIRWSRKGIEYEPAPERLVQKDAFNEEYEQFKRGLIERNKKPQNTNTAPNA